MIQSSVPTFGLSRFAQVRHFVAYQRVGWMAKPPKPLAKPKPPSRRSLQSNLGKLEAEAARIRKQLKQSEESEE